MSKSPASALLFEVGSPPHDDVREGLAGPSRGRSHEASLVSAADRLSPSPFLVLPDALTALRLYLVNCSFLASGRRRLSLLDAGLPWFWIGSHADYDAIIQSRRRGSRRPLEDCDVGNAATAVVHSERRKIYRRCAARIPIGRHSEVLTGADHGIRKPAGCCCSLFLSWRLIGD